MSILRKRCIETPVTIMFFIQMKENERLCRDNEEKQAEMALRIKDLEKQRISVEEQLVYTKEKCNFNQEENKRLQKAISDLNTRLEIHKNESGKSESLKKELQECKLKHEHMEQVYKEEQQRNLKLDSEMQETLVELKKFEKLRGIYINHSFLPANMCRNNRICCFSSTLEYKNSLKVLFYGIR